MALKELSVPRESVKLLPYGGSGARFAALEAKGLDATLLPYGEALLAEKRGFTILADLPELVKEFPDRLIIVRRSSLEKDRGGVKRFLQATTEALFEIRNKNNRERIVRSSPRSSRSIANRRKRTMKNTKAPFRRLLAWAEKAWRRCSSSCSTRPANRKRSWM